MCGAVSCHFFCYFDLIVLVPQSHFITSLVISVVSWLSHVHLFFFFFYKTPKLFFSLALINIFHVSGWVFRNHMTAAPLLPPSELPTLSEVTPLTGSHLCPVTGHIRGLKALSFHPSLGQFCWAIPAPALPGAWLHHSLIFSSALSCFVPLPGGVPTHTSTRKAHLGVCLLGTHLSHWPSFAFQAWSHSPSLLVGLWKQNALLFLKNEGFKIFNNLKT